LRGTSSRRIGWCPLPPVRSRCSPAVGRPATSSSGEFVHALVKRKEGHTSYALATHWPGALARRFEWWRQSSRGDDRLSGGCEYPQSNHFRSDQWPRSHCFCSERVPRCEGAAGAVRRTWRAASLATRPRHRSAYADSTRAGAAPRDRKVRFASLRFPRPNASRTRDFRTDDNGSGRRCARVGRRGCGRLRGLVRIVGFRCASWPTDAFES